jgi:hypothetical protein
MGTKPSRAQRVRDLIVQLLSTKAVPVSTTQMSDALRTPLSPFRTVPEHEVVLATDVYRGLVALEKAGRVARLPRLGSRDAIWWTATGSTQPVAEPIPEGGFNERLVGLQNEGGAQC